MNTQSDRQARAEQRLAALRHAAGARSSDLALYDALRRLDAAAASDSRAMIDLTARPSVRLMAATAPLDGRRARLTGEVTDE